MDVNRPCQSSQRGKVIKQVACPADPANMHGVGARIVRTAQRGNFEARSPRRSSNRARGRCCEADCRWPSTGPCRLQLAPGANQWCGSASFFPGGRSVRGAHRRGRCWRHAPRQWPHQSSDRRGSGAQLRVTACPSNADDHRISAWASTTKSNLAEAPAPARRRRQGLPTFPGHRRAGMRSPPGVGPGPCMPCRRGQRR